MDLQKVYDSIVAALTAAGFTEIEVDLKPKNTPPHVKVFVSCQTAVINLDAKKS